MAELGEQLQIEVADEVGMLAAVTDALKAGGVNIRAAVAWVDGANGHMRMVTDDNERAAQVIAPVVTSCGVAEVVCAGLPNEVGALNVVSRKLADAGIGINLMYASASGGEALVVLETTDNLKAAGLI